MWLKKYINCNAYIIGIFAVYVVYRLTFKYALQIHNLHYETQQT